MSDIFLAERGKRPRRAPSSRYEEFIPPGVNVLVVDANEVSLVITEAKLCHFGYRVFTAGGAAEAASMMEDRSTDIHLVLAEARLPGTEKFEILNKLGQRSDVAVVILADDEDQDAILEALKKGAFFYLIKPIPTVIVTKLWQFALVKKREGYAAGLAEADLAAALKEKEPEKDEKTQDSSEATAASKMDGRKRRVGKKEKNKEDDGDDPVATERRPKLAWTLELHKRFLQAMEFLGPDRAHPRGILQQMNIPGLRKEHISSHLQKYRIYLKNMKKSTAEKSISVAASGIVPAYHLASSLAVACEGAGVITPSFGASSSWAVAPIIGGVGPWLVQSSASAGVTQLGAIGPLTDSPGLFKCLKESEASLHADLPTAESLRNEPNSYNPTMPTKSAGLNGKSLPACYKLPASFSRGIWTKHDGITRLPGSFNSAGQAYGAPCTGRATVTLSTEEVEEKPQLPLLPRYPDTPSFN